MHGCLERTLVVNATLQLCVYYSPLLHCWAVYCNRPCLFVCLFVGPPYCSQRAVFASPLSAFSLNIVDRQTDRRDGPCWHRPIGDAPILLGKLAGQPASHLHSLVCAVVFNQLASEPGGVGGPTPTFCRTGAPYWWSPSILGLLLSVWFVPCLDTAAVICEVNTVCHRASKCSIFETKIKKNPGLGLDVCGLDRGFEITSRVSSSLYFMCFVVFNWFLEACIKSNSR